MSAHPASQRRGWLSALVAQVTDYVFEEVAETIEQPKELVAHPVVAVVAAAPGPASRVVARLLAAELASRADGAAVVAAAAVPRRAGPPSRAAIRLATALGGAASARPVGRLCITADRRPEIVNAARYLAPVVMDLPPDGSAAGVAEIADRVAVVSGADGEPALLDAVAVIIGGNPVKVVSGASEPGRWTGRAQIVLPDSRLAARAATLGTRAIGSIGAGIGELADALAVQG